MITEEGLIIQRKKFKNILVLTGDINPLKEDEELFEKFYYGLSNFRREKCNRFKKKNDKIRCTGAGILLDLGLKEYGLCEKNSTYLLGKNGKPYIEGHPELCFNISHSGDRVMCAFADVPVGCDVEFVEEGKKQTDSIAKRFFTENERRLIETQKSDDGIFYTIWTLKESYVKCIGEGLQCPFDSFSVVDDNGNIALSGDCGIELFSFKEDNYRFGVAYAVSDRAYSYLDRE
ncbi:MAG: 4'-phosphopantetheinyl transferase superfamily protein [Lachnospiraceae bacterium]|nr:4'-phosphopantetheinyl transferase superfamily protein [Lachnospiraceae bacterium]